MFAATLSSKSRISIYKITQRHAPETIQQKFHQGEQTPNERNFKEQMMFKMTCEFYVIYCYVLVRYLFTENCKGRFRFYI
jgi:hypothetical protein